MTAQVGLRLLRCLRRGSCDHLLHVVGSSPNPRIIIKDHVSSYLRGAEPLHIGMSRRFSTIPGNPTLGDEGQAKESFTITGNSDVIDSNKDNINLSAAGDGQESSGTRGPDDGDVAIVTVAEGVATAEVSSGSNSFSSPEKDVDGSLSKRVEESPLEEYRMKQDLELTTVGARSDPLKSDSELQGFSQGEEMAFVRVSMVNRYAIDDDLRELFAASGFPNVRTVFRLVDKTGGTNSSWFVEIPQAQVEEAMSKLQGATLGTKRVRVHPCRNAEYVHAQISRYLKKYQTLDPERASRTVWVRNLPRKVEASFIQ
uniref:RRM domain-containing protein n=1 Tax=Compsopogon caeruleus TaxID=31354 RepID=A0A7S1TGA1_9RHOD|mmetsp:Transcript_5896/g.11645  ORF Transcript_5896/g.11645 Transcript_5896/m.11645 type:complete len:313 (+) Transcript_5896:16-954(+)